MRNLEDLDVGCLVIYGDNEDRGDGNSSMADAGNFSKTCKSQVLLKS